MFEERCELIIKKNFTSIIQLFIGVYYRIKVAQSVHSIHTTSVVSSSYHIQVNRHVTVRILQITIVTYSKRILIKIKQCNEKMYY